MKIKSGIKLPYSKVQVLLTMFVAVFSLYGIGYSFAAETGAGAASSEAAPDAYEDNWWRSVRQGLWEWEGADWTVVESALDRIQSDTGKRRYEDKFDTIIEYGPGHWVYEWSAIGDEAYKEGIKLESQGDKQAARKSFLQSSIYYTQASYPHLRDKHSRAALAKAFEMYNRAGRYFSVPLEEWDLEVDGAHFKAFVHLPAKPSSTPQ